MTQLFALAFSWKVDATEAAGNIGVSSFRPFKIYTNVAAERAYIDGLYLGDDPQNQLCERVDAHVWSLERAQAVQREFLREHGLEGKADSFVQRYLDERDLSVPDVTRITLPTLRLGERVRFTGHTSVAYGLSLFGWVP